MGWYQEYKTSLKLIEVEEIFDIFFYRPAAFLLVKAIYNTRIAPNHLTLTAIAMGIISGFFFALGDPVTGAFFFLVFNILDCSDGQLARLKRNGTPMGKIIDGLADYTATTAVFIGIAIGFADRQENQHLWLMLLALTGISIGIHSILVDFFRTRFLDYTLQQKSHFRENLTEFRKAYAIAKQKGHQLERFSIFIYLKYSALQKILAAKRKRSRSFNVSPADYYRKNRLMIRLWLLIGPTTQITNIIVCSLCHRIDLFMWIVLVVFNMLASVLWIIQQGIDFTYKPIHG